MSNFGRELLRTMKTEELRSDRWMTVKKHGMIKEREELKQGTNWERKMHQ